MKFLLLLAAPACVANPAADGAKADSGQTDADADGYTLAEGDCDDANDSVNPGAVEVCDDGVDNDCDESPGACGPTSASLSTALQYTGESAEDFAGHAVSGAGDVNADGYDDFVVGAPGHDSNSGAAYLVLGSASPASDSLGTAVVYSGNSDRGYAGASVSAAGDVDGDGYDDFLVSSVNTPGPAGIAYLVLGSAAPVAAALSSTLAYTPADGSYSIEHSVAGAGDVNADGYDDFLVASNKDFAGTVYLLLGSASPAGASLATALQYTGETNSDGLGYSASNAGDVDGDGYDDLILGAPQQTGFGNGAGGAYLILGSTSPFAAPLSTVAKYTGEQEGDGSGVDVSGADDINADGYDDFLIGRRPVAGHDGGNSSAYLVLGSQSPASASLSSAVEYTGEVGSVSGAGDVDADGYHDFLVGGSGEAYLVLGTAAPAGGSFANAVIYTGGVAYPSLSAAGDVDANGYGDLLIGEGGNDDAGHWAGTAYLVLGRGL